MQAAGRQAGGARCRRVRSARAGRALLAITAAALLGSPVAAAPSPPSVCNATLVPGWSAGATILSKVEKPTAAGCCAACLLLPECVVFVLDGTACFLKADAVGSHAKAHQTTGFVSPTVIANPLPRATFPVYLGLRCAPELPVRVPCPRSAEVKASGCPW